MELREYVDNVREFKRQSDVEFLGLNTQRENLNNKEQLTVKEKRKEEELIIRDFINNKEPKRKSKQTLEVEAICQQINPKNTPKVEVDKSTEIKTRTLYDLKQD